MHLFVRLRGYKSDCFGEWHNLNPSGLPWHLFSGCGFAYLFYTSYMGSDATLLIAYEMLNFVMYLFLGFTLIILAMWYWYNRLKINYKIFLLASFKIYLTMFFSFVLLPYVYINIVNLFVSIAIFAAQARYLPFDNEEIARTNL